jgi:hypothetical protein
MVFDHAVEVISDESFPSQEEAIEVIHRSDGKLYGSGSDQYRTNPVIPRMKKILLGRAKIATSGSRRTEGQHSRIPDFDRVPR